MTTSNAITNGNCRIVISNENGLLQIAHNCKLHKNMGSQIQGEAFLITRIANDALEVGFIEHAAPYFQGFTDQIIVFHVVLKSPICSLPGQESILLQFPQMPTHCADAATDAVSYFLHGARLLFQQLENFPAQRQR